MKHGKYINTFPNTVLPLQIDTGSPDKRNREHWPRSATVVIFFLTGAPYRAKLFLVGKTSFWIVYEFDEGEQSVNVLRIWNSKQDPDSFDL